MDIRQVRRWLTDNSTISDVLIDGVWQCYFLEDRDRGLKQEYEQIEAYKGINQQLKVYGKTAIPEGYYEIGVTYSNRFQKALPLLFNVPVFKGIRIHPGNFSGDTEGCLLPGTTKGEDAVFNSKVAFSALFAKIAKAVKKEKIYLTIEKG